jgi:hypothetical protein
MEFQVRVEQIDRRVPITVLHLSGWLNLGSAAAFEQAGKQAVQQGARYLLLDLKDVPAVRSAGLRSVQVLYKLLNPKDAPSGSSAMGEGDGPKSPYLKLVNLSPDLHNVFDIAGFLHNIAAYDDMETALNSFG